jgi:uncharacterized protein HemX
METSGIVFLAVAASISFALGRTVVYFRNRKRKALQDKVKELEQQAAQEMPPQLQSRNRSKRKRQLQQLSSSAKKSES